MSSERATVRPVTLSRLVEVTFLADEESISATTIETELDVSHRRAREALLEAERVDLIEELRTSGDEQKYAATAVGTEFISRIENESWSKVADVLRTRSPHFKLFLDVVEEFGPLDPDEVLDKLKERSKHTPHDYNEASLDVVGDWAQRLGEIQRNAFSGTFYIVNRTAVPPSFPYQLITTVDTLEETTGVNLQQRYLSIPELREELCERIGCSRAAFDDALVELAEQNVGRLELSGAPIDTGAKDARFGIKSIAYADDGDLITTKQSSEQIMRGVEMLGKQYYYLAIHDKNLQFNTQ